MAMENKKIIKASMKGITAKEKRMELENLFGMMELFIKGISPRDYFIIKVICKIQQISIPTKENLNTEKSKGQGLKHLKMRVMRVIL